MVLGMGSRSISIIMILCMMAMSPLMVTSGAEEITRADGNTLYVDVNGGSTYNQIFQAVNDAEPGDEIIVNPGTYITTPISEKRNLTIRGNSSDIDVVGMLSSGAMKIHNCSNITIYNMNLYGAAPSMFGDGSPCAVRVNNSMDITFGLTRFNSRINESSGIEILDSENITCFWSFFESEKDRASAMYVSGSKNVSLGGCQIDLTGTDPVVLRSVFSTKVYFSYPTYVDNNKPETLIEAYYSEVSSVDMDLSITDIIIDFVSVVNVCYDRSIYLRDETNNTMIQAGDLEIVTDGEQTYATPHYGGDDPVSDSHGAFPYRPPLVKKSYYGFPIQTRIATNTISAYYDGGDVAREVDLGVVDANTSDPIYIHFDDYTRPNESVNLTAETFDHQTIYLSFENSTSDDVSHYELWYKKAAEWKWKMNVTMGDTYSFSGLEPATNYSFKVVVVDDAGLRSDGLVVYNTTDDPINGTLNGTVYYSGGPLDGEMAENATVHLLNESLDPIMNEIVNGEGYFEFSEVPFQTGWNYTVRIIPENAVVEGGESSGYTDYITDLRFVNPTELSVGIDHYMIPTNGTLRGHLILEGGGNASNATVIVLNSTMEEIAGIEADMNGSYMIENLEFGHNYTLEVIPENAVEDGGTESGHIMTVKGPFNFTDDVVLNVTVDLYTYTPPPAGPISGTITYDGGPRDGETASGVTVSLTDEDGMYYNTTTNETGEYLFEEMEFGSYSIEVIPMESESGETGIRSGYMILEVEEFTLDSEEGTQKDGALPYYNYEEPQSEHPTITIMDENGDPVEGAVVTVEVDEEEYIGTTDENGVATFPDYEGEEFPEGSLFQATHDDMEDISWSQGEDVPAMPGAEDDDDDYMMMLILIIAAVVLIVIVLMIMVFIGRNRTYPEE